LKVLEFARQGSKTTYTIIDGTILVGYAVVHSNTAKSWWKYVSPKGLLIPDFSTRRAMDKAIREFNEAH